MKNTIDLSLFSTCLVLGYLVAVDLQQVATIQKSYHEIVAKVGELKDPPPGHLSIVRCKDDEADVLAFRIRPATDVTPESFVFKNSRGSSSSSNAHSFSGKSVDYLLRVRAYCNNKNRIVVFSEWTKIDPATGSRTSQSSSELDYMSLDDFVEPVEVDSILDVVAITDSAQSSFFAAKKSNVLLSIALKPSALEKLRDDRQIREQAKSNRTELLLEMKLPQDLEAQTP
jgi:hypothetical protein